MYRCYRYINIIVSSRRTLVVIGILFIVSFIVLQKSYKDHTRYDGIFKILKPDDKQVNAVNETKQDLDKSVSKLDAGNTIVDRTINQKTEEKSDKEIVKDLKDKIQNFKDSTHDNILKDFITENFQNLPIEFCKNVENKRNVMHLSNSSCAQFPNVHDLDVQNSYWQTVYLTNVTTMQLYSAYYDDRQISPGKDVRVLAMVNRTSSNFPGHRNLFCQMWFDNEDKPVIVSMNKLDYMWIEYWGNHEDGMLGPYLLGCSIPPTHKDRIPEVVSIVEKPCDNARNMLRVVYEKPEKKNEFSVCVKGPDQVDNYLLPRLVEWIEFLLLMGVNKIYFYQLELNPGLRKVFNYYTNLDKVDVRIITHPSITTNNPPVQEQDENEDDDDDDDEHYLNDIMYLNDCFYRNIHSHKYVSILDIDEIILPLKDNNWHALIERSKKHEDPDEEFNSFTARHILFADTMQEEETYSEIPPYMHMMQHVYRSQSFSNSGECVKTIFSTKHTISCHNQWPFAVAPDTSNLEFHLDDARMQQYLKDCPSEMDCELFMKDPVKDTRLWDFKDVLIPKVVKVVKEIGLFADD